MTANRYGVTIAVTRWEIQEYKEADRLMLHIKNQMRSELGVNLFKIMEEEIKTPVVVKLSWVQFPDIEQSDYLRFGLIADIEPVKIMHVVIPEFDPISWGVSVVNSKSMVYEWQCSYCGQVNLIVEHLECRKCGAPRNPMR